MRAVVSALVALIVAAALVQPAAEPATDYIWLDNAVQQTSVRQISGAGPMIRPEAQLAVDPLADYFFLAGQPQARAEEAVAGWKCAGCGGGPAGCGAGLTIKGAGPMIEPEAQTDSLWNF